MTEPKVSVCIPAYNSERFLGETIESVLNQTFKELELIIVDDCSKDSTVEIVKKYAETDGRIKFFQNGRNLGLTENWNECLRKAGSEYVQLLCADDLLTPQCIRKKYDMMLSNPSIVLTCSATDIINEDGKRLLTRHSFFRTGVYEGTKVFRRSFRRRNLYGEPSNVMIRKTVCKEIGGFSDKCNYSPDWECWLKMSLQGDIGYIDEAMTKFRVSSVNLTGTLISDKNAMKKDEEELIKSLRTVSGVGLSDYDLWLHKLNINSRTTAKKLFYRINVNNNRQ